MQWIQWITAMMDDFECQDADDNPATDEWVTIEEYDEEFAASKYAEQLDSNSGGEIFRNPHSDVMVVRVRKRGSDSASLVIITFDYSKEFYTSMDGTDGGPKEHCKGTLQCR